MWRARTLFTCDLARAVQLLNDGDDTGYCLKERRQKRFAPHLIVGVQNQHQMHGFCRTPLPVIFNSIGLCVYITFRLYAFVSRSMYSYVEKCVQDMHITVHVTHEKVKKKMKLKKKETTEKLSTLCIQIFSYSPTALVRFRFFLHRFFVFTFIHFPIALVFSSFLRRKTWNSKVFWINLNVLNSNFIQNSVINMRREKC